MKKIFNGFIGFSLTLALVFSTYSVSKAQVAVDENKLEDSYIQVIEYSDSVNSLLDMSLETYLENFYIGGYDNIDEYKNEYYLALSNEKANDKNIEMYVKENINVDDGISPLGAGDAWYYNTGTTLPRAASYTSYRLLDIIEKGDVIYEANGGLGVTGHAAIVEGRYWSTEHFQYYIRIIEAISPGVVRSVLEDGRVVDKGVSILKVKNATSRNVNDAVNFAVGELGTSYNLDFQKDYSSSETDWYCSELVWASYKNQGIDIETTGSYNEPGVTPRDLVNSSALELWFQY